MEATYLTPRVAQSIDQVVSKSSELPVETADVPASQLDRNLSDTSESSLPMLGYAPPAVRPRADYRNWLIGAGMCGFVAAVSLILALEYLLDVHRRNAEWWLVRAGWTFLTFGLAAIVLLAKAIRLRFSKKTRPSS